eukprot:CAMPEP_0114539588 /NCGR_PEP_ID=MMETSP0114-20121206/316_1 /TAXON_ID=31324 /ORGANISM="Goniomonas sp, Strain m" /LENGTH=229 /DNA_ID=CAMNT_0001723697 /DNA_START=48 /DNA_END=737 /DNA_ORIENTATION=-
MSAPNLKLTYFGIAGAAEKVRIAFTVAGVEFTDERIAFDAWPAMKPTTPYGQLPLLSINGGAPITDSGAMLRYAGRLGGESLYPVADIEKQLKVESVLGLAGDFDRAFTPCLYVAMRPTMFGYPEDYAKTPEGQATIQKLRAKFVAETLPTLLGYYTRLLKESGGGFFCGDTVTIADCHIFPQLANFQKGHLDHIPTTCLDTYPEIVAWLARMRAIPSIAAYTAKHAAK